MLRVADLAASTLESLLARYGIRLELLANDAKITGSFWGEPEAGVVGRTVFARADTPVHSLLHETSHVICMDDDRRDDLDRDAGGDDLEEAAVCYLQIVLAAALDEVGRERLMQDMDDWGYSFRLGSTSRWFREDADDARQWLQEMALLDCDGELVYRLRGV